MRALYNKLHRALFDLGADDIGISLPDHKTGVRARTPGYRLRLHGKKMQLTRLMEQSWLKGMRDHVQVDDIQPVPENASHLTVRRRQFKTGNASQVRRYARRHSITVEKAESLFAESSEPRITLPFIQLNSRSSGQRFALFIEHGAPQVQPVLGRFSRYGLSSEATVPWF